MSLRPFDPDSELKPWPGTTSLLHGLRALSFWSAIVLPFFHLPLLIGGLDTLTRSVVFLGLLALNIVTLVIGHSYQPT